MQYKQIQHKNIFSFYLFFYYIFISDIELPRNITVSDRRATKTDMFESTYNVSTDSTVFCLLQV